MMFLPVTPFMTFPPVVAGVSVEPNAADRVLGALDLRARPAGTEHGEAFLARVLVATALVTYDSGARKVFTPAGMAPAPTGPGAQPGYVNKIVLPQLRGLAELAALKNWLITWI